jgi:hypothetical protein
MPYERAALTAILEDAGLKKLNRDSKHRLHRAREVDRTMPSHAQLERRAAALRIGPLASFELVYWNGTHPSVFEFRVEKERDHDFDAAGASV